MEEKDSEEGRRKLMMPRRDAKSAMKGKEKKVEVEEIRRII